MRYIKAIGAELRRIRESRGLTARSVALWADIHPNTLARLENGENVGLDVFIRVCVTLRISPAEPFDAAEEV